MQLCQQVHQQQRSHRERRKVWQDQNRKQDIKIPQSLTSSNVHNSDGVQQEQSCPHEFRLYSLGGDYQNDLTPEVICKEENTKGTHKNRFL